MSVWLNPCVHVEEPFVRLPPLRKYNALPTLLRLEGRFEEAEMYQDRWEKFGTYQEQETETR